MQQVPNPECSSSATSNNEARWSRIPRVQLLRNKNDQRVPLYFDQTVPVWPIPVPPKGHSTNASPSSKSSGEDAGGQEQAHPERELGRGRRHGELKLSRKWVSDTVWFRSIKGRLRTAGSEAHSFNVSEILRSYDMTLRDYESLTPSKWSGIEQDLFTCTPVDPKVFVVPTAADSITKILKSKE
ncbi:uncharacterized protein [Physcomitrium patens]|uniref:Uncharacterized protein n=1 Tax=Physcomitrium patens TaxID=3218 RepID=A0A2K1J099_PHYPA|nr:uncharacterized protein LOC112295596 [Physcomitrium patens]PNR34955.1 hypothetical protein PHYPA_022854 [Physcomitrium patens]|eukprot:XP_024403152.1 uncharacterized protein LOC112295596 [Physcomitrella patens]